MLAIVYDPALAVRKEQLAEGWQLFLPGLWVARYPVFRMIPHKEFWKWMFMDGWNYYSAITRQFFCISIFIKQSKMQTAGIVTVTFTGLDPFCPRFKEYVFIDSVTHSQCLCELWFGVNKTDIIKGCRSHGMCDLPVNSPEGKSVIMFFKKARGRKPLIYPVLIVELRE